MGSIFLVAACSWLGIRFCLLGLWFVGCMIALWVLHALFWIGSVSFFWYLMLLLVDACYPGYDWLLLALRFGFRVGYFYLLWYFLV